MESINDYINNNISGQVPWGKFLDEIKQQTTLRKPPTVKRKPAKKKTIVILGDHQAPYYDHDLHELTLAFMSDIKADGLIYTGDGPDFDSLSVHRSKPEFSSSAQQGLNSIHTVLKEIVDAGKLSGKELIYIPGNHEIRLNNKLLDVLPSLFGIKRANVSQEELSVLHLSHLMRLPELGFEYVTSELGDYPHATYEVAPRFYVTHGWMARKGGGNSARGSIERLNGSLVTGHTHNLTISYLTRWNGASNPDVLTVAESGTMADAKGLGYARYPDWQNGFLVLNVLDGKTHLEPVLYQDGELRYRDQVWIKKKTFISKK